MPHAYSQGDEPVPGSGYRLSKFLGRGGFGEVWKATAPGGAEAALKIIHLGGLEGRKEFRALQLVKRIRHPNLVPIVAFWLKDKDGSILDDALTGHDSLPADEGAPAPLRQTMVAPPDLGRPQAAELIIAMGLGDLSLFDRLEQCRAEQRDGIPPDELLRYMEDVAEAIDFLNSPVHDMGSGPAAIQHCDIKPHNLMVVGGAAQICDFGLARMMGADRATTAAATIAYAAPECLQTGLPSASTDQYSLAVTYFELRTGVLPYNDETLAAVMDAKQKGTLDFSRLTAAEQAVLRRATLRDPAERFPSAVAMVKALREAFAAGTAPTQALELPPAARRGRRLVGSLLLLAVLAGAATAGWSLWNHRGGQLPDGGGGNTGTAITGPITSPVTSPLVTPPPGIEAADALADRGEWNRAIIAYTNLIGSQAAPATKAKAYFGRGRAYSAQHNYDDAIADFEAAIGLDANDAQGLKNRKEYVEAVLARGIQRSEKQNYNGAIADLQRAAELAPNDARAASYLGQTWLAQKDFKKAAVQLEKAISLDSNSDLGRKSGKACAEAYLEQGTAALKQGNYDEAILYFDRASGHDSLNALVFVRRAGAWFGKKDFAKAIDDLTASIKIKENDADYVIRGLAYRERGDLDKALSDFADAARLNPQNAAAFAHSGDVYMAKFDATGDKGDLDRAKAALNQAVAICQKNPGNEFHIEDALRYRALCHMLTKEDYELAAGDFEEILRLIPNGYTNLHVQLDELAAKFAEEGKFPKAAEWQQKAVNMAPDDDKADYRSRLEKYRSGKP